MKIAEANEDGNERSAANVRELVTSTVLDVIALKYYPTKIGTELTEAEARAGLEKMGGLDQVEMDEVNVRARNPTDHEDGWQQIVTDRILSDRDELDKIRQRPTPRGSRSHSREMDQKVRSGGGEGSARWSRPHGIQDDDTQGRRISMT